MLLTSSPRQNAQSSPTGSAAVFFFVARPANVGNVMQLEEVEVGADAGPKHPADDQAIMTTEARNDPREVETVQSDGQAGPFKNLSPS